MQKNFSVADAVAIQTASDYVDLHNNFDLHRLVINFEEKKVCLTLVRAKGAELLSQVACLDLTFSDVDYLSVSAGVFPKMICDIVELGYKNPQDFNHDWLMREDQATPSDHLFFRLSGDEFIRLHCKLAVATPLH